MEMNSLPSQSVSTDGTEDWGGGGCPVPWSSRTNAVKMAVC